jgi:regulator of protease activity HflC (stomatin/prohibitin superfamily)
MKRIAFDNLLAWKNNPRHKPSQDVISKDNVSVRVNAIIYFRAVDPQKAIIQVENYFEATSQLAQTTLLILPMVSMMPPTQSRPL